MIKFLLVVLVTLTACQPLSKAQEPGFSGRWDGTIEIPGSPLGISVELRQGESWVGTIDIPSQGTAGAPLRDVQVEGQSIVFAIADIPGEPTFDGALSGDAIEGTFSQDEQSFPFTLTRLSEAERAVALEQGRTLTQLFYDRSFNELYATFSGQFQATMSRAQLETFRQQVEDQLGAERSVRDEAVNKSGNLVTYTRTAVFDKSGLFVAVQWVFSPQGVVEDFSVQPRQDIEAPTTRLGYRTQTALQLPFDGFWYVFWGGRTVAENYHAAYPDQRFAYDFLVMKGGSSHRGNGVQLTDYYCFGRPIYASGAGTVVEAVSNLSDNPIGTTDAENALGNHVVIGHWNGEFSFLAHLKKGSVKVTLGAEVEAGAPVGTCGNSGNTSEPHLHYQLQAGAALYGAEALPAQFLDYTADGKRVPRGEPLKGQMVER